MLTPLLKAEILRKTGFAVPAFPTQPSDEGPGGDNHGSKQWVAAVETLFVTYVAARAAKSLRDAEEVRQLDTLRRISSGYSGDPMQAMRA